MEFSEEIKKQIIEGFLEVVARIADKEFQKRIWIRGEGPECDTFTEAVCQFFDAGNPILKDYKNFNISNAQYELLEKFRNEFDIFSDHNSNPQKFIESPEWDRIVKMAGEVLKAFNFKKK